MSISQRKKEHLELALTAGSEAPLSAGWEDVRLVPRSLPELGMGEVDMSVAFLGRRLEAPLVIASMTGGHDAAVAINEALATAAEALGIAIGSGSQRAALRDPSLARSYTVLRRAAPRAVVMANVGVSQLVPQRDEPALGQAEIERAVEMLEADALIIHLNVLEEIIQPEGDATTSSLLGAIEKVVAWSPVPVMAKETGAGLDGSTARALADIGIAAVDVGGAGGTNFARIEGARAAARGDTRRARLGDTFASWGIPTAMAILDGREAGVPIVATGGIRSGLDAAKAIALGADAVGVGRPALEPALRGPEAVVEELSILLDELRVAMVLTASKTLAALRSEVVLTGAVAEWQRQRHGEREA